MIFWSDDAATETVERRNEHRAAGDHLKKFLHWARCTAFEPLKVLCLIRLAFPAAAALVKVRESLQCCISVSQLFYGAVDRDARLSRSQPGKPRYSSARPDCLF